MQNFLRLNEGDIVEIIIAFINKNVGNETITEVDYDKLGIHIDSDILIKETPIIINVRCKLNLTEMIRYIVQNKGCSIYIQTWKEIYRIKRNKEIVLQISLGFHIGEFTKFWKVKVKKAYTLLV